MRAMSIFAGVVLGLAIGSLAIGATAASTALPDCLAYHATITLEGTLVRGPTADTFLLHLPQPVCVIDLSIFNSFAKIPKVQDFEIDFDKIGSPELAQDLIGKQLRLTGLIFPGYGPVSPIRLLLLRNEGR
jgi:hypothetical protein